MNTALNPETFEKLFRADLEANNFPIENVKEVCNWAGHVLRNFSLAQLNCDVETFESISRSALEEKFNLYNISFVLNGMSSRSAAELQMYVPEYIEIQKKVYELSKSWNALVGPIRSKLMNKLPAQAALTMPRNGKSVIPGNRIQ